MIAMHLAMEPVIGVVEGGTCLTGKGFLEGTWAEADIIKSQVSLSGKL
jgi:hypothetical protein